MMLMSDRPFMEHEPYFVDKVNSCKGDIGNAVMKGKREVSTIIQEEFKDLFVKKISAIGYTVDVVETWVKKGAPGITLYKFRVSW